MNRKHRLTHLPLALAILISPALSWAQSQPSYGRRAEWLLSRMENLHAAPRKLDDKWSRDLFDTYVKELDPNGYFLTTQDLDKLASHSGVLHKELAESNESLLDEMTSLYERRVKWADSLCTAELANPFDYTKADPYEISWGDAVMPRLERTDALARRWRQYLRYEVLETVFFLHNDSTDFTPATIAKAMQDESKARERVARFSHQRLQRKLEHPRSYCGEALLRAMALTFDPHSCYFSPVEEEEFVDALSTHALSLGLELDEDESGEVTIGKLVPGGPAWRSGKLHEGDQLVSINGTDGKETDLSLSSAEEIQQLLDKAGKGAITLTVRKKTGVVTQVTLVKEVMRSEENVVRSLVIDAGQKIGYISLPGFYTDWEDEDGVEGCANDVAREILKLKKDGVQGIILDLRFNGGGSLKEAAELAGIFIDAGPLWIGRNNDNVRTTTKDPNRGAMWEGPLALMVNAGSASASEFIAGALQDHNRAIVVGSRTYGKATGQITVPLDPVRSSSTAGYVKVTTQRFYHLDGRTHQLAGIVPDVELADPVEGWITRERDEPFVLIPDTIVKKTYYTPGPEPDLAAVQERSRLRLKDEPLHRDLVQVVNALNQYQEEHPRVNLVPQEFFTFREDYLSLQARWDEVYGKKGESLLTVKNNSFDAALLAVDEYAREAQQAMQQHVSQDVYLRECVRVLEAHIGQ